jgi:hypothetical protein
MKWYGHSVDACTHYNAVIMGLSMDFVNSSVLTNIHLIKDILHDCYQGK